MGESSSHSDWEHIDRRHRALIALGVGVLVLTAVVVGVAIVGRIEPDPSPGAPPVITPAEQTEAPASVVPSYTPAPTPTVDPSEAITPGDFRPGTASAPGATAHQRAALVAYRRDGALCVASEDGSGARTLLPSASGAFALSPDGTIVAAVDDNGVLWLHAVAGGQPVRVGAAEPETPAWAPDSSWLVYTAPGPKVMRVGRDGADGQALMAGRMPAVAADGGSVVAVSPVSRDPAVLVWRGAAVARHTVSAPVTGVACDGVRIYLGTAPSSASGATLRSVTLDGKDGRVLVGGTQAMDDASFVSLGVSPDGVWLAYACHGDDGRSEVYALRLAGGDPVRISGRRDSYPLQWGATPGAFYLIEGNALQGETSSLVSVTLPAGTGRLVVPDASR